MLCLSYHRSSHAHPDASSYTSFFTLYSLYSNTSCCVCLITGPRHVLRCVKLFSTPSPPKTPPRHSWTPSSPPSPKPTTPTKSPRRVPVPARPSSTRSGCCHRWATFNTHCRRPERILRRLVRVLWEELAVREPPPVPTLLLHHHLLPRLTVACYSPTPALLLALVRALALVLVLALVR